ncbi:MAG: sensor signal transduction histidine kinase [Candidatus Saccharibacteria bacterium]|jgi:signal transduction histidine kinase|nr:sensor signal transduction histidine kinase [Candidatus Saccharibacteria bacterium]
MTIRQKSIALLLVIGLVPTLVVSILAFATISTELNKRTADQISSIAIKQQQTLNAMLQSKQEEAIKLANGIEFQTALGNYLAKPGQPERAAVAAIMRNHMSDVTGIKSIHVTTLDDIVLASTQSSRENTKLPSSGSADDIFQGPVISIREDPADGLDRLFISTRLKINSKDTSILQVVFRIDDLQAAVQDYTGLGDTGETMVLTTDSTGKTASLLQLRFTKDDIAEPPYSLAKDGKSYDYRGHEVMAFSRPLGFSNWIIATKIDTKEALAPITQLRNSVITIFIISSILVAVIAVFTARFFTAPILSLARTSKRIGEGDFTAFSDVKRDDEIGELAESINAMGMNLKSFVANIETQRNRLDLVINSTDDSIIALDYMGYVLIANQSTANLTRLAVHDLVGKRITDIFSWTRDGEAYKINYIAPGTNTYTNLQYVDMAGETHWVRMIVARVSSEHAQKEAQTIITLHDETKTRELESMKLDFVSMAAHELRTPLAAIRGYLELITFKMKKMPDEVNGYLAQSLKSAGELSGLINNLLDVSRIERGTLTLHMEKVDLAESVARAVEESNFSAEDKRIELSYNGPSKGHFVAGDEIALREVVNNLISNAIKYTDKGGSVVVTFSEAGGQISVAIKDTGHGIPKNAISHLFTKFYRVHGGLNSGSTGTGLGLFIAKSILEHHDGTIGVETKEGVGSTFTFTVPVLTEERLAGLQQKEHEGALTTRRHRGWVTKNTTR